ncbi:MAG: hypothetical protein L0332_33545 [Chloroflexi bacterium]|nr:hypothetical protein [Chloroflexota bacterium]
MGRSIRWFAFAPQAAENSRAGLELFGQSTTGFLSLAQQVEQGTTFPELILVGRQPGSELVVLEGHVRLTAYALALACLPEELEVIVGYSPDIIRWGLY